MEFDSNKARAWIKGISLSLPDIERIFDAATSDILVIGAGVFDIYFEQGWIPAFKRKTGDLDLSVGLVSGEKDYDALKKEFIAFGYRHFNPQYRFFPPKENPGAISYVDLLAHPHDGVTEASARSVMGAGPDFSFNGIPFASLSTFEITAKVNCPNPFGLIALKAASYCDDPLGRIKDLADIAELAWGLVEKGTHFKMKDLWSSLKNDTEAERVKFVLNSLGGQESVEWDLENARQELLNRTFSVSDIDEVIPARLIDWVTFLD